MPSRGVADWPEDLGCHARTAADAGLPAAVRRQAVRALASALGEEHPVETQQQLLCTLALMVADENQPREVREEAFNGIRPVIGFTAARVAISFSGQPGLDLLQEAESYIWERLPNFRPGRFQSWCHTVLRNLVLDWLRRRKANPASQAARVGQDNAEDSGALAEPDFRPRLEATLDQQAPFSHADLFRIQQWEPWDRVLLLCLSGLWTKVAPEQWAAWMGECGVVLPFPPQEFAPATERRRNGILAAALGIRRNTLAQRWSRGRPRLAELDYLRGLRDDP